MSFSLSGLYIWRRVCALGYMPLESYLSTFEMTDESVICYDPLSGDDTEALAKEIADKFPERVFLVPFVWPMGSSGDGSVIGVASQFGLGHVRTTHVVNVQADEIWPTELMQWTRDNWKDGAQKGLECLRYKVLNTEHNLQLLQGGVEWNGRKDSPEWEWQPGAGYNTSIKLVKKCPAINFAHDAWSFEGCGTLAHCALSNTYPIIHGHDRCRDSLVDLRRTAADAIWTDQSKFGHYKATADSIEATKDTWFNDKKWTRTTSPFQDLLPWYARDLLGRTSYSVNWKLLEEW